MREACQLGKTISSHTFIIYPKSFLLGIEMAQKTIEDEKTSTQFLEGTVAIPGSAPVIAHAGSRG